MIDTLFGWTGEGAPWGGAKGVNQTRFDAQAYFEYGLTDDWTIFGQTAFESYALGPPKPNVYHGLDYSDIGLRRRLLVDGPMGVFRRGDPLCARRLQPGCAGSGGRHRLGRGGPPACGDELQRRTMAGVRRRRIRLPPAHRRVRQTSGMPT